MAKKKLKGIIVSDKMTKTVVVKVERSVVHPKYRKRYRVSKRYKADNADCPCALGDLVIIEESRPISKEKNWRVIRVIESKAEQTEEAEKVESEE